MEPKYYAFRRWLDTAIISWEYDDWCLGYDILIHVYTYIGTYRTLLPWTSLNYPDVRKQTSSTEYLGIFIYFYATIMENTSLGFQGSRTNFGTNFHRESTALNPGKERNFNTQGNDKTKTKETNISLLSTWMSQEDSERLVSGLQPQYMYIYILYIYIHPIYK